MKLLRTWLWFASLLPLILLFGKDLGLTANTSKIILASIVSFPFIVTGGIKLFVARKLKIPGIAVISLILILANIMFSIDYLKSMIYWFTYLILIVGITNLFKSIRYRGELDDLNILLTQRLSVYLNISTLIIFLGIFSFGLGKEQTMNSLGIISGSAFVYQWFKRSSGYLNNILLLALLGFILIYSLSRSSIVLAILSIYVVEIFLKRRLTLMTLVLVAVGVLVFSVYDDQLLNLLNTKQAATKTIENIENLGRLNEDRFLLIKNFFDVFVNNIFVGYGVDTSYYLDESWNNSGNVGVHNGILETLLYVGLPLGSVFIYYFWRAGKSIYNEFISSNSYASLMGFMVYSCLRTYGESYFLLNVGNVMSLTLIMVCIFYGIKGRKLHETSVRS